MENDIKSSETSHSMIHNNDIPLQLAVKKGCVEIVEEIFDIFRQVVGYK